MFFSMCIPVRKSEEPFPMKKCALDDCDATATLSDCKNGMDVEKMSIKKTKVKVANIGGEEGEEGENASEETGEEAKKVHARAATLRFSKKNYKN